jgi:hypothetical protein
MSSVQMFGLVILVLLLVWIVHSVAKHPGKVQNVAAEGKTEATGLIAKIKALFGKK